MQKFSLNKVKDRILILSPIVQGKLESELKTEDFEVLDRLGQGAFGKVYKTKLKKTGIIFALKQMEKQQIKNQGMIKQIQTEVRVMYNLDHPNIIKLFNHFEEENYIYLMIEYAGGGQLWQKLKKEGRLDENTVKKYMADIILAVEYLHSQNPPIIHRDIKPENIMLDETGRIKLVDFGWSNFKNRQRMTFCGTPDYLAPEMILEQGHDEKLDIWSIGVLTYELLTGKAPFTPRVANGVQLDQNNARALLQENILKLRLEYPSDFPQLAKDLVSSLLKIQPNQRKTLAEVKKHPWFILEKEGKNIFEMEPWSISPTSTVSQVSEYSLLPTQIYPLQLESGFSSQFIASFANRLYPTLVKTLILAMQSQSQNSTAVSSSSAMQNVQNSQSVSTVKSSGNNGQGNSQDEVESLRKKLEQQQSLIQELNKQKNEIAVQFKVKEEENIKLKQGLSSSSKSLGGTEEIGGSEQRRLQLAREEIEKLKAENEKLYEKQNELERDGSTTSQELKKAQDLRKDLERYKQEKNQLLEKVRKMQEEKEQSSQQTMEAAQQREQELSMVQFKLAQYEKAKGLGGNSLSNSMGDMVKELNAVLEEMKKKFVLTKKQVETIEKYGQMEREVAKLRLEKDTLEADLRAQVMDEAEEKNELLVSQHSQQIQQLKDEYENKLADLQKRLDISLDEQSKKQQKLLETDSLRTQLDLAQSTIKDLLSESDQSKKVKQFLEKRVKETEDELSDLQLQLRSYKNKK